MTIITLPSLASDPIFTVENIAVDVTAANAIKAREQAFEQAQIDAFNALSARMVPEATLSTLVAPDPLTISTLIQDFEITNEQLSAVRYVGTYTFRFKADSVRKYFSRSGTQFSDVSSKSLLILPFIEESSGDTNLWSPYNPWRQAWNRAGRLGGLVPIELPLGDLTDVRDIRDNEALSYRPRNLSNLISRYDASEAVIAIAIPDQSLSNISSDQQNARGNLTIEIYRTDRQTPELVQQLNIPANGIQTKSQLFDAAVLRVHQSLQRDWKARTIVRSSQNNRISVAVPIQSLQQWVGLQSDLKRITGINEVMLRALTPRQAMIDIVYQGTSERLAITLRQAGLTLEQSINPNNGNPMNILKTRGSDIAPTTPAQYQQSF